MTSPPPSDRSRGVFKNITISLLRGTIDLLEGWLARLEDRPPPERRAGGGFLGGAIAILVIVVAGTIASIAILFPFPYGTVPETEPSPPEVAPPTAVAPNPPSPDLAPPVEPAAPETEPAEPEAEPEPLPDELTAPAEPEPVELAPPPLPLTPEERLIAAVRDRITEAVSEYETNDIVEGIEANFAASVLRVQVGTGWSQLARPDRQAAAKDLFDRAKTLDFSRLELTDLDGNLVARSPVIGTEMVLFEP